MQGCPIALWFEDVVVGRFLCDIESLLGTAKYAAGGYNIEGQCSGLLDHFIVSFNTVIAYGIILVPHRFGIRLGGAQIRGLPAIKFVNVANKFVVGIPLARCRRDVQKVVQHTRIVGPSLVELPVLANRPLIVANIGS